MLVLITTVSAQDMTVTPDSTRPNLYVVGTAHLDTQWRWTIQNSIEEFIPATFRDNLALMKLYPEYVFSFEGSFRYQLMDEYYHDEFEQVRPFIGSGQWRVTGSWVDAVDVNLPSFESLVRHTLYGNSYFKREFGKTSRDIFLPDCFGFGYALPSIARHCGLESFSTQKLTWGAWVGVPFDIGIWKGVDGSSIICGVNPGKYVSKIEDDLSSDTTWYNAAERQGDSSGLYAAYHYFGTGDSGGSPDSASVDWLVKSIHSDGPLAVHSIGADDLVDIVKAADISRLPEYDGELVMTRHGVGCYTSEAAMKRWNRKNELLADAAERAAVIADFWRQSDYPRDMLRDTWTRFLWHQFHDDLTGTSIPEAYEFSWNDEILCLNRFSAVLEEAVSGVAAGLDTRAKGTPVVVYNPLSIDREEVVGAVIHLPKSDVKYVQVIGPDGSEVPADVVMSYDKTALVRFLARVPSVGFTVYDIRPAKKPSEIDTGLKVTLNSLENERYVVMLNDLGEVASVYDKQNARELLGAPLRYEFLADTPKNWPAWEIDYNDIMAAPEPLFVGEPQISVIENGSARVGIQVVQKTAKSTLTTIIRLSAGEAGNRVEFFANIDWGEEATLLKLALTTAAPSDSVTYDIGLGTITRPVNTEKRYEVPGQQWADISAPDRSYGVALMNDCRYGWDHPTPEKLRLTLVHTPGIGEGWAWVADEHNQDQGVHTVNFAIQGHTGDWADGGVAWQASRLNQPLTVFETSSHKGSRGMSYSLVNVDDPGVMVNAVKKAEESDEIVIRLRELTGNNHDRVTLQFDRPVLSAREINGMEEKIGPATVEDGRLVCSFTAYQPKAFAVLLGRPEVEVDRIEAVCLDLPFNMDGVSLDADRCDGDFDGKGYTIAGEFIPDTLVYRNVPFVFGDVTAGALNAVACEGQKVELPKGDFDRLYLLAASTGSPAKAHFKIGEHEQTDWIMGYADPIGQWDNRLCDGIQTDMRDQILPAYINRQTVAWYGSHRHTPECENEAYRFTYLFPIELEVRKGDRTLTLPDNDKIRIMSATAVRQPYEAVDPAQPLYDIVNNAFARIFADSMSFAGRSIITMDSPIPNTTIRYTLDGTEPTATSALYTEPIIVTTTTTISARAFSPGYNENFVARKTVAKLELRDSYDVGDLESGLNARYYEGEWDSLPGFDTLEVVTAYVADSIVIPDTAREEYFGLVFEGFVKIPADGVYALSINSDDGSRIYFADTMLVNNNGLHGDFEKTGLIGLKAGLYPIRAEMFQCEGDAELGVHIAGPSLPKQPIPTDMLFHAKSEIE